MLTIIRCLFVTCCLSLLGGCGPVKRINPSTASIQQLQVLPDGRWQLDIRVQNFSSVSMQYVGLQGNLEVAGIKAGDIALHTELEIPGESVDIMRAIITPDVQAREPLSALKSASAGHAATEIGIAYTLKGSISVTEPKRDFEFEHKSRLTPVPGLADVYR